MHVANEDALVLKLNLMIFRLKFAIILALYHNRGRSIDESTMALWHSIFEVTLVDVAILQKCSSDAVRYARWLLQGKFLARFNHFHGTLVVKVSLLRISP